tara:strand:- start:244 stop:474 length:231 start_codon:yes stop_codon:yes gene_type:complete
MEVISSDGVSSVLESEPLFSRQEKNNKIDIIKIQYFTPDFNGVKDVYVQGIIRFNRKHLNTKYNLNTVLNALFLHF